MNPCSTNRKGIALLAVDGLDGKAAQKLREHLRACPGCRQYWNEIGEVCRDQMRAAADLPDVEADNSFHRRLEQRVAGQAARSASMNWAGLLSRYLAGWRIALPVAAMAVFGLVLLHPGRQSSTIKSAPVAGHFSTVVVAPVDSPPTLSTYRLALSRSFEEFDELLNRNSARDPGPSEPVIMAALGRAPADWP